MRTALVHDWLTTRGGSEMVLQAIAELLPDAPIHTLVHWPENFRHPPWSNRQIHTSFLQRLPLAKRHYKNFLPLMPLAIESFNLEGFDTIVSSNHAVAKGALTTANQLHISYVHTPIRYAWDLRDSYMRQAGLDRGVKNALASLVLHYLRLWDHASASRVDLFIANSNYIARRIWKTYRRTSRVIYPPVDVDRFTPADKREPFFLTVSRLVPYKYIDRIVAAFSDLNLPLIVIGDGPQRDRIETLAGPNVKMLGQQPDEVVRDHMQRCRAFVFMADEDFGIVPVEAQAAGAPVIAYGKGGSLETVIDGQTGFFFPEQTTQSLTQAVRRFEQSAQHFRIDTLVANAKRFSRQRFQQEFQSLLDETWERFRTGKPLN